MVEVYLHYYLRYNCGPGSAVGIPTGYGMDGAGIESRWVVRFSAPIQADPGAHPASCTMGTGSFPGVKSGRGVTLTPHPLLVPWSRKSRDIPLLPLWAVRPVQSLSACKRVHFTPFKVQLHVSALDNSHLQVVHEPLESSYTRFNMGCVQWECGG